ncbi:acetyl-CoA synthetase-like protein [Gymnopus androsaceus JB14]|uniref:Acetyl-CoA synthetase-like protein n=1 Tax=Gymnopus androsaceus JB14 TaxID=1447944 RepID=A0A6A4H4W8_9AGAR|nr:acetyl-CoA synthetase-like protein [Gymnopus androsaceus JB14]
MTVLKPSVDAYATTIPQVLRFHYEHNPSELVYVYSENGKDDLTEIKYLEFIRACHRAAHLVRPCRSGPDREVVGVIALVDTIVYTSVTAGLMEAGLIPFPISPRNTPAAVINLLKKTGTHRILGTQSTLQELFQNIKSELAFQTPGEPNYDLTLEEIPGLNELFPKLGTETEKDPFEAYPLASSYPAPGDIAAILHSSGSTGLPKPVPFNYFYIKTWLRGELTSQFGDYRIGTMSLPFFHVMGFFLQMILPLYAGNSIATYPPVVNKPQMLPVQATPDNIMEHLRRTRSDACFTVPAMLQIWAQSPSSVDLLRSLAWVVAGGGPLAPAIGDFLVANSVTLRMGYGGTEFNSPSPSNLENSPEDWAWHRFPPDSPHVRWNPQGNDTFELQCLVSKYLHSYRVAVENLPDVSGFATADLFKPHPTKPGLWFPIGRMDDVIIHSSGEKTVPQPFEECVNKSPLITAVVMFGRQRDQPGVLLEPSSGNEVGMNDQAQVSDFRNKLWPIIEEANRLVPAFSRIYKEMILIASSTKPLPRTPKGAVMRKMAYKEYEKEINQIYEAVDSNINASSNPSTWDLSSVQQWLTAEVKDLCYNSVDLSDDIFEHGFDSLCATILRLRIMSALRRSGNSSLRAASRLISQNTVYNYPTIERLSELIVEFIQNPNHQNVLGSSHEAAIEHMISSYSSGLEIPITSKVDTAAAAHATKTVALLTGSTGNLGAQILALLLSTESVALVYTLNRYSKISILQRHQERFKDKELDVDLLSSDKLVLLEGDSWESHLGLTDDVYNRLQDSLTLIIHNAWRLDFNLSLSSFEPHVHGTRNLIDLARSSRYASSLRFLFTSSIGSAQSWNSKSLGPYPEEVVSDPQYAIGSGYGESKYISERILAKSGLNSSSFRIGQITGGRLNPAWAMSDWLPMIIKSSLTLGMLPDANGIVSWAPVDALAEAILDVGFFNEDSEPPLTINLVHPRPVSWTSVMGAIRESLISAKHLSADALPMVPFQKWAQALEATATSLSLDPERIANEIPAAKIMEFVRAMSKASDETTAEDSEALGGTVLKTTNILRMSRRMQELNPIGHQEAELWVGYWVQHGL